MVLLLPGFFYFVGFYLPERFTRQLAERSALGHLAAIVLVSLVVHGSFLSINQSLCGNRCVRVDRLLELVTLSQPTSAQVDDVVPSISQHPISIVIYNTGAALAGLLLGALTGALVVAGPLRPLAQHTWVYGLLIDDYDPRTKLCRWLVQSMPRLFSGGKVEARALPPWREVTAVYVLTRTAHEGRILMYRGYLRAFGIRNDGTFTYLVLVQPLRLYMELTEVEAQTSPRSRWHAIATSTSADRSELPHAYLLVDGANIANVMFDRERMPTPVSQAEFDAVVAEQNSVISAESAG